MLTLPKDKGFSKFFHVFVDTMAWAKLSFKAKAMYIVILRHARWDTMTTNISEARIALEAGVSIDSVSEAIKELCINGMLNQDKILRGLSRCRVGNLAKIKKS